MRTILFSVLIAEVFRPVPSMMETSPEILLYRFSLVSLIGLIGSRLFIPLCLEIDTEVEQ